MSTTPLVVRPLPLDAEVAPGDDLAALLLAAARTAGVELADGDVVAVASKVVAKAEDAHVPLPVAGDVDAARRALALAQAARVVADSPWVLVVETHHGLVCANAGVDTSNVPAEGVALLLPDDPDASAAGLRAALLERTGVDVGVLVTDTFGRPWRLGQTDVAVGAAGVEVLRDDRGRRDRGGRVLGVSVAAVGDALAAAADLVRRKADGTPFVLLRGLDVAGDGTAATMLRPSDEDLFRTGGPTTAFDALDAGGLALRTVGADRSVAPGAAGGVVDATVADHLRRSVAAVADGVTVEVHDDTVALAGTAVEVGAARTAVAVVAAALGLAAVVLGDGDGDGSDVVVRLEAA